MGGSEGDVRTVYLALRKQRNVAFIPDQTAVELWWWWSIVNYLNQIRMLSGVVITFLPYCEARGPGGLSFSLIVWVFLPLNVGILSIAVAVGRLTVGILIRIPIAVFSLFTLAILSIPSKVTTTSIVVAIVVFMITGSWGFIVPATSERTFLHSVCFWCFGAWLLCTQRLLKILWTFRMCSFSFHGTTDRFKTNLG